MYKDFFVHFAPIILVVAAQALNAASILLDKFLLVSSRGIGKPSVYTFYVNVLSLFVIVLVPFGFVSWPSHDIIWLSLLAGSFSTIALFFLFSSFIQAPASDSVPAVGALSAITTFVFAKMLLAEQLPDGFILSFILIVLGMVLVSNLRFTKRAAVFVVISGVSFGITAFALKLLFNESGFVDGFFWSRIATVLCAIPFIAWPKTRVAIFERTHRTTSGTKGIFLGNKILAGIASVFVLLAIETGSVSMVNALAGIEFVYVAVFAYFLSGFFPGVFDDELNFRKEKHKLVGIILITLGFFNLFV